MQSACVGLTASGSVDPATEVSLNADVTSGGLSPYLQVWVERGSVPDGGTCGTFTGTVLWSGTLDSFPDPGTPGIATGWRPAATQRSVYRFTVTVLDDPRAASLSTSATFRWAFTEAAPPPPPPPPTTPPPPTAPPIAPSPPVAPPTVVVPPTTAAPQVTDTPARATERTAGAAPSTSGAPADVTTEATPSTSPSVPVSSAPVPPADGGSERVVEAPPLESGAAAAVQAALAAAGQVAADVGRTVEAVARNGQYPLALVGVVAAFLFLQGRLDRRDPKLALARVREELSEYRDFPGPPHTETT
ncbi:hypothetical protein ACI78T_11185 [Blastococcus sp. SYSU D00922]